MTEPAGAVTAALSKSDSTDSTDSTVSTVSTDGADRTADTTRAIGGADLLAR